MLNDSEIKATYHEISDRHASSGFIKPEIPPRDFDNPDASIEIEGKLFTALMASNIPPLIEFSGGVIDTKKTKEKRITLYTPKSDGCLYSQGHTIEIAFLSIADRTKRTIITQGNDVWTLDTLQIWTAPTIRSNSEKLFIDVAVQIGWVQDIDWSATVLLAVNGVIKNKVNPSLPTPLFSLPVDQNSLPEGVKISRAALRIAGCWHQAPSVVIDLKFA